MGDTASFLALTPYLLPENLDIPENITEIFSGNDLHDGNGSPVPPIDFQAGTYRIQIAIFFPDCGEWIKTEHDFIYEEVNCCEPLNLSWNIVDWPEEYCIVELSLTDGPSFCHTITKILFIRQPVTRLLYGR